MTHRNLSIARKAISALSVATLLGASQFVNAIPIGTIINVNIGPLGGLDQDGGLSQTSYSSVDYDGDGNADVWNNMGQTPGSAAFGGLQDIDGNELGDLVTLQADGVSNRDGNSNNDLWMDAQDVPTEVINSWYFRGTGAMALSFNGLGAGSFRVEIFNAFNSWAGTTNTSDMTVNGLFADGSSGPSAPAAGDGWNRYSNGFENTRTGLLFSKVATDSGSLLLSFAGNNPTVQAVRIERISTPATLALFVLGLSGLYRSRRQ